MKLCTLVGSDDPTCSDSQMSVNNVVNEESLGTLQIREYREGLLQRRVQGEVRHYLPRKKSKDQRELQQMLHSSGSRVCSRKMALSPISSK